MSWRCRAGLHRWGRWHTYREVTKYLVHNVIGQRVPEQDYEEYRPRQWRQCQRCGLTERRTV